MPEDRIPLSGHRRPLVAVFGWPLAPATLAAPKSRASQLSSSGYEQAPFVLPLASLALEPGNARLAVALDAQIGVFDRMRATFGHLYPESGRGYEGL